ncbi:HNH endonuclease [Pseudomonas flavescens]|uniref:HNH endonuclease n=1 Tax=Phytopseudomonas flavescens TaxID=29435 RepID=A0A1G8ID82_9GAMM|nr:HNH endonuclease signature motif containing protein [Pseudomonas flavescens]SDI16854.1 HNH endonuclease [Pseudomonas flavescens]
MLRIILGFVVIAIILDTGHPGLLLSIEGKIGLCLVALSISAWEIYSLWYFRNEQFLKLKSGIKDHATDCNNLNRHIEELKRTRLNINSYDYGLGDRYDTSRYNFKRNEWAKTKRGDRIHNCSASVCKAANDQPFKYLCKYFYIDVNEETLSHLENALNNYLTAYQGKVLLEQERDRLMQTLTDPLPSLFYKLNKSRLAKELGLEPVRLVDINFQTYKFQYVSPGGNSSYEVPITLDMENLERFIKYLGDRLRFKNSAKGQRALMTPQLREKIKTRDKNTCQRCGISVRDEPNLLIEIDHIIPISKRGTTTEDNLQALCWRCNRAKGATLSQTINSVYE